jgi:hypothetical protein
LQEQLNQQQKKDKMKNLFIINEEEKNRILNLHETATKRHYLTEQLKQGQPGDPYEYKLENGNYYFRNINKGETKWTTANEKQSSAIKSKIFKETPILKSTETPKKPKSSDGYLVFNGTTLKWVVDGKVVKSWKAVSGRTKYNTFGDKESEELVKKYGGKNTEFMKIKEEGPIPVGKYTISQLQKRTNGDATNFIQGKTEKELYNIMVNDKKGHNWNTGTNCDLIAWGDYRLPISKSGDTNTFGRGSFYIHGGGIPGSIGCIDLLNQMNDFVKYFEDWKNKSDNKKLNLIVNY